MESLKPLGAAGDGPLTAFFGFFALVGALFQGIASAPPSPGYEPLLTELGIDPILARSMAGLAVKRGRRIANDSARLSAAVEAIRFLAGRHRNSKAVARRVKVLLAATNETSVIEEFFVDDRQEEFEFVRLLQAYAEGHSQVRGRLSEIAAGIMPHLSCRRGPKVRAASASHEYLLGILEELQLSRAYTWNESDGEFSDAATAAARKEFGLAWFDPRPARRRQRSALNLTS